MPQRYSGINQTLLGINQMGNSRVYLWYGQLQVSLLATDNANMTPTSFTYHVVEHYIGGLQYDIVVPMGDGSSGTDIHSLIIPGSICSNQEDFEDSGSQQGDHLSIPITSSQYLAVDITTIAAGMTFNPTTYPVNIAFISGPTQPQSGDWHTAAWASDSSETTVCSNNSSRAKMNGLPLAAGTYQVWAQVVATPQVPVIPVGFVTIY